MEGETRKYPRLHVPGETIDPIVSWHICISGFRQARGEQHGTWRLWRLLDPLRRPGAEVQLHEWDADWASLAELIEISKNGRQPTVRIYAYSWGAGYGCMKLARELAKRGIAVRDAVLSDPVYRSPLVSLRWLALLRSPRIRVPANVRRVWSCRQESDPVLRGHRLVAEDPARTQIDQATVLDRRHSWMDDAPAWHLRAQDVAFGRLDAGVATPWP